MDNNETGLRVTWFLRNLKIKYFGDKSWISVALLNIHQYMPSYFDEIIYRWISVYNTIDSKCHHNIFPNKSDVTPLQKIVIQFFLLAHILYDYNH